VDYDGYSFDVTVCRDVQSTGTLWGGYTLMEYLANGGSIYITATGFAAGAKESGYTEVLLPADPFQAAAPCRQLGAYQKLH
jgi:hypothetical protein